jgi:MFS superfamily sulfate permease-like transporter
MPRDPTRDSSRFRFIARKLAAAYLLPACLIERVPLRFRFRTNVGDARIESSGARGRRRYSFTDLPADFFAGVTLWAVFSAQALAYSRLAHATPVAGLSTAIAGALVYSLLGSSRRISIGPAGGICAIVGASVANVPAHLVPASIAALTLMAALFLCTLGLLRVTFLQRLFPEPVFVGYLAGTGITILIGQGHDLVSHGALPLAIGVGCILAVLALKRLAPRVPGQFVVLALCTVASVLFRWPERGVPVIGRALGHFGSVTLPTEIGLAGMKAMLIPALSLALFVYVDSLANADALAHKDDPPLVARREYFALGATNLLSGLFGGFVAGCSTSRSVVATNAGARTRVAPLIAAALLFSMALSVVRFLEPMPLSALAGVVFVAAFGLIDRQKLGELRRLRRPDFQIAFATTLGVVIVGPMWGVGIGVIGAIAEVLRRAMRPERSVVTPSAGERIYEPFVPDRLPIRGGLVIYRFGAPLFFGNSEVFLQDMREVAQSADPELEQVVVNADALGIPDATARDALVKAQEVLRGRGVSLVFGNARKELCDALAKVGSFTLIDEHEFLSDLRKFRAI